ncbi:hypothetical protein M405DRAFT_338710 [Rhizopogon salebrosus TDB-379]|nr:hypothetical protein M405DRAFT_338710 [Rhizopogon salebrosus TDB-379]
MPVAVRQMFNDDEANNLQVLYHCLPSPFFYSTTAADQLTANHVVFDNDVYNTPSYLPCAADMISTALQVPDCGFATPRHPTMLSYNHPEGQFSSDSVPEPDLVCTRLLNLSYSTTTDASGCSFGHNPPTLHSTEYYDPMLGCISARYPSPQTVGINYPSSHILPGQYPNHHASHLPLSSQYSAARQDTPLVSRSALPLYNDSPHEWQNFATPQPGPPSLQLPTRPAALTIGSSQFHSCHLGHISPPPNQLSPIPIRFYNNSPLNPGRRYRASAERHPDPSPSPLISCRWLIDDIPCGFAGPLGALSAHCKSSHFSGPKNAQIECRWEGCDYRKRDDPTVHVMRRDCIWRHTYEIHLGMKRGT